MTLTPEQKAEGWIEWSGGPCPLKDERTTVTYMMRDRWNERLPAPTPAKILRWTHKPSGADIIAYRIIEAHGADAEPARPTPFPRDYSELVWDADGWSQTIIVDGKRPEWLRDDDRCVSGIHWNEFVGKEWGSELAVRVRRREPKRETGECFLIVTARSPSLEFQGTIDLIDGEPDLSTLKIGDGA